MSEIKKLKIPKRQMVKCEACGQLHDIDDCEEIIIRMVKGKNCVVTNNNVVTPAVWTQPAAQDITVVNDTSSLQQGVAKKKTVIPPSLLGVMIPTDDPNFEQFGDKIKRRT